MAAIHRELAGKVALVTGAGSGIGEATARMFGAEAATVIVSDILPDAAESVAAGIREAGGAADAVALDVTDEAAWSSVIDRINQHHGALDVLVNCAGISISRTVASMTMDEWRTVMAVNLDGVFLGTKYAILAMTECGGGSIVNVASISGILPSGGASNYCASKAGVRMFSKAAAIECADAGNGVRINVVTPGGVMTPMWEREAFFRELAAEQGGTEAAFAAMSGDRPSQQFFTSVDVARTILYLASDKSSHLTGIEIAMNRGHSC